MAWDVIYYAASDGSTPAIDFLDECPPKVAANLLAVLEAVAEAPPPQYSGGGKWEAMHGSMGEVRPAFDPAAVCAIIEGPQLHRFGLVIETRRAAPLGDVQGAAVATADVPAEWDDTLVDALQNATLYHPSDVVTLDGISYRVDADTRDIRCSLDFANPRSEGTMRLERGLLAAVEGLERAMSIPLLGEYLDTWRTYISSA